MLEQTVLQQLGLLSVERYVVVYASTAGSKKSFGETVLPLTCGVVC